MLGNTPERYGIAARLLHWSVGLGMLGLVGLGWWMVGLGYYDPWYYDAVRWHEGIGVVVWVLALALAFGHLVSRPPVSLPQRWWARLGSRLAHGLLYLAMLVLPATGYLISTADGKPLEVFGWFQLPALVANDEAVRDAATFVHTYASYALLGLVAIHAGAAVKHHLIDRDRTLLRMVRGA